MKYRVRLVYKDGESLDVMVGEEEIDQFFTDLSGSQVYIHPESKAGFWTNLAEVRYITANPTDKIEEISHEVDDEALEDCGAEESCEEPPEAE